MVPVSLLLSNFTSYGTVVPLLDFRKFHLAAISGQNGAGKSSLLDALTWCLWGTSRLGDSADQLVRLGQSEMFAELQFALDGHTYTVKRRRVLKSGGSTSLEFFSGSTGSPQTHNLTEGTIKATQQKIIDTLRLTYETFINSAFIRQGHADEFTTKGATERKKILADILGLFQYDLLEEKAKEKSKEAQNSLQLLGIQLLEIEAELSQKEEREKELSEAQQEAERADKELQLIETEIKAIEAEKETINTKLKSLQETKERIEKAQKELDDLRLQISLKEKAQQEYKNILSQREEIEKNYQLLQKLQEGKKALEIKRTELIKTKDGALELERKVAELDKRREAKIKELEIQIKSLETEDEQKLEQIKQLKTQKNICPTCGQPIGTEKNKQITAERSKEIEENYQKINALKADLAKVQSFELPQQKELDSKHTEIKKLEDEIKDWFDLTKKISDLSLAENRYLKLQQAETAVRTQDEAVSDLKKILESKENQTKEEIKSFGEFAEFEKMLLEVRDKLQAKEIVKEELAKKSGELKGQVGAARQLVDQAKQLNDLFIKRSKEKEKLKEDKENFDELALAFGKKGIQAMIIETAIPEIEDETNSLLDRLTEGRMRVRFDTQKETKSGTTVETLDIIISDEMGERPYEAYSVDGNELVYIRKGREVISSLIKDLWSETKKTIVDGKYQFQKTDIDALCYVEGKAIWQKVDKILRHRTPDKILKVKCGPGNYTIKLTKNHSIYVLTDKGLVVKRTEDLKTGDFLLSPRRVPGGQTLSQIDFVDHISNSFIEQRKVNNKQLRWDQNYIWSRTDQKINRFALLNEGFGKLLGIAAAEGSGKTAYSIAAGSNKEFAYESVVLAEQVFGNKQRSLGFKPDEYIKKYIQSFPGVFSNNPKSQYQPVIGGRLVSHIMKDIVGEKASLKKIPEFIFNAPCQVKLSFLKGLIAGDGYIRSNINYSKSEIGITTVSRRLTGEIVFLCRQLGIWARIENHGQAGFKRGMNHQKSYRVVISGKNNLEILGLGEIVSRYDLTTKYEGIPHSLVGITRMYQTKYNKRFPRGVQGEIFDCGVRKIPKKAFENYKKIQSLVEEWNILEVNEIKEINPTSDYVYDLMVPGNNSFVAGNGMVLVHNSGGEQFRVNLAIRLALSKLLTHRAGSKLQFLVIDEGFGTQDTQGISRIIEALNIIKDDFEKILVITHLNELKEEFPVRIEVQKGPEGSTFEVVES